MKRVAILVAMAFVALLGAGGAEAVTWDFGCATAGCSVHLGTTQDFTASGLTLHTAGFNPSTTAADLNQKNETGSLTGEETGLGLFLDPQKEISTPGWVRVDLGAGLMAGGSVALTNWMIDLGSIQTGENYSIFTSALNNAFSTGTACENPGINPALHPLCPGVGVLKEFIFITGGGTGSANILLTEIQATAVPEPATMFLGGLGIIALGYAARRRLFGR